VALATSSPLRRQRTLILTALITLSAAAWIILVWQARSMDGMAMGLTMGMDATLFLAIWVVMMAAMMFPAAAPMILMFAQVQAGKRRQGRAAVPTWLFTASYLLVWAVVGVAAYLAAIGAQHLAGNNSWLASNGPRIGGCLLIAAGIYQVTPFKRACLAKCRSPFAFVMTSWRDGATGAVRMGVVHGLFCLGCCWFLFAILFPLGMMNIAALGAITVLIFAEKALPGGERLAWIAAAALIGYGIAVVVSPGLLPGWTSSQPQMHM
jgi:predicted metal-binding membrane protein